MIGKNSSLQKSSKIDTDVHRLKKRSKRVSLQNEMGLNILKSDFESTVSLNISPSSTNLNTGELSKKLNLKHNSNEIQNQPQTLKSIIV